MPSSTTAGRTSSQSHPYLANLAALLRPNTNKYLKIQCNSNKTNILQVRVIRLTGEFVLAVKAGVCCSRMT